jgi:hypothetical protein
MTLYIDPEALWQGNSDFNIRMKAEKLRDVGREGEKGPERQG